MSDNERYEPGDHLAKKDAVREAFEEYIQRRKQIRAVRLFGTIDYYSGYDYKAQRARA